MKKSLLKYLALLTVWAAVIAMPLEAYAVNYKLLDCEDDGTVKADTQLFPVRGAADKEGAFCGTSGPVIEHIFSWVLCQFTMVLNDVLSKLYCGMQDVMVKTFSAVATLYIAFMGAQLLMGTIQMTARDVLVRLLKLSIVFVFISESTYGIGLAFNFFLDAIFSGIYWTVQAVLPGDLTSPDGVAFVPKHLNLENQGEIMPVYQFIDKIVYSATIGPLAKTNEKILGIFIVMSAIMPPLFGLAVSWLITCFTIMVRALVSFMLGISAIAFLISLSPIFLSFMLFRATYHFFENWLKYMISYTLQIIIVFACIGLWIASTYTFVDFFKTLGEVTFEFKKIETEGGAGSRVEIAQGTCPFMKPGTYTVPVGSPPTVKCDPTGFNPVPGTPGFRAQDVARVIPPSKLANEKDFIEFLTYNVLSLLIVSYAFNALLKQAPSLAQQLAGPEYVPLLGEGFGFNRYGIAGKGASNARSFAPHTPGGGMFGGGGGMGSAGGSAIKQFISNTQKSLTGR